jgi:multidrug efflux pump subunit AcrA (membrane-fusion protein)
VHPSARAPVPVSGTTAKVVVMVVRMVPLVTEQQVGIYAVIKIPSQAVIFNQDGLRIAVVSEGKVELHKIDLDSDNGASVDVRTGLKPGHAC